MKKVSILTPTFNQKEMFFKCLASVSQSVPEALWDWTILDNGKDGLGEMITQMGHDALHVLKGDNSLNYAQMNNLMAELAKGEYLLFLNDDTMAAGDFLSPMVKLLDEDEELGAVGALLFYPNGTLQHAGIAFSVGCEPVNLSVHLQQRVGFGSGLIDRTRIFQAATGACLLVRKSDFQKIGGFDEGFHWAYEDVDFCLQLRSKVNKATVVCHQARLVHHESVSGAKPQLKSMLVRFSEKWQEFVRPDMSLYESDFNTYIAPGGANAEQNTPNSHHRPTRVARNR